MAMEYTEYGVFLLVISENNKFFLLNVNNNYKKGKMIELEPYFTSFDIDEQNLYKRK